MRILFTTPILEYPPAGGPALRIINTIKALNMLYELHIISRVPFKKIGGYYAEKYIKKICYKYGYSPNAYIINILTTNILSYRFKTRIIIINEILNTPIRILNRIYIVLLRKIINNINYDTKYIKKYINKNKIDIVWFGYGNISYELMKKLKNYLPKQKMVFDTNSVR